MNIHSCIIFDKTHIKRELVRVPSTASKSIQRKQYWIFYLTQSIALINKMYSIGDFLIDKILNLSHHYYLFSLLKIRYSNNNRSQRQHKKSGFTIGWGCAHKKAKSIK